MAHNSIKDYYAGATVFITGGSGFMGKAIIEKLLRTCSKVERVYALMREKRGVSSAERLERMKKEIIFDRIRQADGGIRQLDKLHCVTGDINVDRLGLNAADTELLLGSVNIVIHSAATVRFNEPVKVALNTNVLGTKRVLELCIKLKHLKRMVHISTAYSNPISQSFIEEKVYKPAQRVDLEWFVTCANTLDDERATKEFQRIYGSFPNTYTLTKHMSEILVEEYRTRHTLPLVIVRPSVVGCSYAEPYPGWVDTFTSVSGIAIELGRGTVGSIYVPKDVVTDMIPLDYANNMVLVAAWYDALRPSTDIRVINFTVSRSNNLTYSQVLKVLLKYARIYPTKYTMLYPHTVLPANLVVHKILEAVHTFLPAHVADVVLMVLGQEPTMVKIQQHVQKAMHTGRHFFANQWTWANGNVSEIWAAAQATEDADDFVFDVRSMDWDLYLKRFMLGTQKYMLKCGEELLPRARKQLQIAHVAWLVYYACLIGLVLFALYSLFI